MTFTSDLSKVRIIRQKKTNKALAELLCHTEGLEDGDLKPYLNFKAFDRLADLYETDREDLYSKCAGNYDYALAVANGCAIKSSRQGSTDERYVLEEIDKVKWYPSQSAKRIAGMVKERSDWCISRQRSWGLPIPVFYFLESNEIFINKLKEYLNS